MPSGHRSAANSPGSTSLFPASHASRMMDTHCARPFLPPVLSPAACTQTGSLDRNTCTVCTNAVQIRTSGIFHRPSPRPALCRTARTGKQPAFQACLLGVVRKCDPASAAVPQTSHLRPSAHHLGPDNQAVGISPRDPPQAAGIVSPACPRRQPHYRSIEAPPKTFLSLLARELP